MGVCIQNPEFKQGLYIPQPALGGLTLKQMNDIINISFFDSSQ